jgi:hypothetical protein
MKAPPTFLVRGTTRTPASWDRTSVGVNWFINKHDTKVQLAYRMGENLNGVANDDEDEVFLQTQFVF